MKSMLSKCSDCNICKGTESLIADYIKLSKQGKAKKNELAKIIFPDDEKPIDFRKINLDEFKKRRNKYKSIIVLNKK